MCIAGWANQLIEKSICSREDRGQDDDDDEPKRDDRPRIWIPGNRSSKEGNVGNLPDPIGELDGPHQFNWDGNQSSHGFVHQFVGERKRDGRDNDHQHAANASPYRMGLIRAVVRFSLEFLKLSHISPFLDLAGVFDCLDDLVVASASTKVTGDGLGNFLTCGILPFIQ